MFGLKLWYIILLQNYTCISKIHFSSNLFTILKALSCKEYWLLLGYTVKHEYIEHRYNDFIPLTNSYSWPSKCPAYTYRKLLNIANMAIMK